MVKLSSKSILDRQQAAQESNQSEEKLNRKREREKALLSEMVSLYCYKQHKRPKGRLCPECKDLLAYAEQRSDHCPFMATKTFCSSCPVHCYSPDKREQIRRVMRFAGPRMLFYHPLLVVRHALSTFGGRKSK